MTIPLDYLVAQKPDAPNKALHQLVRPLRGRPTGERWRWQTLRPR